MFAVTQPPRLMATYVAALTRYRDRALTARPKWRVLGVLSGHVHDAFDIAEPTSAGPIRMIGAGTLSRRTRSTPASFNELHWDGARLEVMVRNMEAVSTRDMMITDVPEDAMPPRVPDEPVAPIGRVPPVDPPVH